jgi:hypothetical protein
MKTTALAVSTLLLSFSAAGLTGCGGDDGGSESGADTESTSETDTSPSTTATTTATTTSSPTTTSAEDSTGTTDEPTDTDTASGCTVRPGDWTAPDWENHVGAEMTLRTELAALVGAPLMRGAETGDVTLSNLSELTDAFEAHLAAATHDGFQAAVTNSLEEFFDVIEAGPRDLMTEGNWAPGPDGGIWGDSDRGINEGGIEVRQIVDKGLFGGGAFYFHALQLTEGTIDEETLDRIAYIWGNNADLDPEGDDPLVGTANYSFRQGFHADMAAALTAAKAYAGDAACDEERDAAIIEFFRIWETSVMSRVVYYVNQMAVRLAVATTPDEFAEALHQLAEGLGLASGFHGLPHPTAGPLVGAGRVIGDQEIEDILDALGFDMLDQGSSTTGTFVESLPNYEAAQSATEAVIRDTYGVDQATIATWRTPTPG